MRGFIVHSPQPRLPARTVGDVMQTPPMAHDAQSPAAAVTNDQDGYDPVTVRINGEAGMADEEHSEHVVGAWTVGQLRAALEGLPDDLPIGCEFPTGHYYRGRS